MKVFMTDFQQADTKLEARMFADAGIEFEAAQCQTAAEVIQAAQDADALIVSYAPVTAEVIAALPKLRFVTTLGAGVDHVDIEAAKNKGIWVSNVPDAYMNEVATTALAMSLALIRHLPFFHDSVTQGHWDYKKTGELRRPSTLTLGIVGMGRIGQLLATLAKPCFRQIVGADPYTPDDAWPANVKRMNHNELFQVADVVSLHMPLTDENQQLVNHQLLAKMKPGSYIVNVARGGLIDLQALLGCLNSGHLAGAALDVLPQEPPMIDDPALKHPRLLLTPHSSFYSIESELEACQKAVINILKWAEGDRPPYVVIEGENQHD
jgi:D-3-phosphoglycerate dehydrogenase